MSGAPDWLKEHRELEYLRAAAMQGNQSKHAKKKRIKERYRKLREVQRGN